MYTPAADTQALTICPFAEALNEEETAEVSYDRTRWLYVPCRLEPYRYILGTRGEDPLICIGINPSTAAPDDLDNTLKSVQRIAENNGFDSFIMFNVYAQRATDPDRMDEKLNEELHRENMAAFDYILSGCGAGVVPTVWAAWGTIVEKRPYLTDCLRDMVTIGERHGAHWVTAGRRSKKGHPHHPLYLRADSAVEPFDVRAYLGTEDKR